MIYIKFILIIILFIILFLINNHYKINYNQLEFFDNKFNSRNYSFLHNATNIKYNNNELLFDLKNKESSKTYNIRLHPHIKYFNNNNSIDWKNSNNNVMINNINHKNISRRYKKVSIKRCLDNLNNDYDDWFNIEDEIINSKQDYCISISLFKKNSDNTYNNEFKVNNDIWNTKYYNSLIKNLNNFKLNNIELKKFNIDLYIGNNLKNLVPILKKYKFLNIYIMKSESIGAQPGMLWRFINMSNKLYKAVFITDIDESWDWIYKWDNKKDNKYMLYTLKPKDNLINNNYLKCYNFPTIIGSYIRINPQKFNINIKNVIKGFISLCKKREKSINPYCFNNRDPITHWNHPIDGHKYGWGRLIYKYGFDELFLKHVIYYYVYPSIKFFNKY